MNKPLEDNSYSQSLLSNGVKTETAFSGQQTKSKSGSCAQTSKQPRDGGYTIIESLVAMIVVSVLMIAIAPVMAFSVATRVQARRTELATQAGKAYIDGLRSESIKYGATIKGFPTKSTVSELAAEPPPKVGDIYCVDMGGGCSLSNKDFNKDFYVQGVWLNKDVAADDPTSKGYQLLVRVYRADSFASGAPALTNPKDTKQSIVGSGLGNRAIPVVEMSTEIPATGTPSYDSISDRLKKTP